MSDQVKWTTVYKSTNKFDAEVIKGNIESQGIPCVMMNKQDSSYQMLLPGMVELLVSEEFMKQALNIINEKPQSEE